MTTPWNDSGQGPYGGQPGPQQPGFGQTPPAAGYGQQPGYGPPQGGWQGQPPRQQPNPGAALGYAGIGAGIVLGPVGLVLGVMSFTKSRRAGASTVPGVVAMVVGAVWTLAVAIVVVVTTIASLSEPPPTPPPTDPTTPTEPTTPTDPSTGPQAGENPGDTDAEREVRDINVAVGNCISSLDDPVSPGTFLQVPCAQPHDAEVVAEYTITETDFPGTDEVQQQADDFCGTQVPDSIPDGVDRDRLSIYYLYPTETTWADGDRIISCFVRGKDGALLEGSAIAGDLRFSE